MDAKRYNYAGDWRTVAELSEMYGIGIHVLHMRLNKGWPIRRAVTEPVEDRERREIAVADDPSLSVEWAGKVQSLRDWSDELSIPYNTLYQRLYRYGWEAGRAFTAPVVRGHPSKKEKINGPQEEVVKQARTRRKKAASKQG